MVIVKTTKKYYKNNQRDHLVVYSRFQNFPISLLTINLNFLTMVFRTVKSLTKTKFILPFFSYLQNLQPLHS